MGKILIPGGGGGGAISDDITLRQSDVPVGLTAVTYDSDDEIVEGTLTTTASPDKVLKDETFYNTETHQKESGTIESMESQTITPGASAQTVSCTGKYMTGDVTINAVAGLSAGNIANGVTVGGVAGTYKGLGNATQNQVLNGCTFSTGTLSNASGTMTNYSGYTSTSNYVSSTFRSGTTGYVFASPGGTGYYTTGSYLRIPATNLSPSNIKKGVTILGITGTFEGYATSPFYIYNNGTWSGLSTTGSTKMAGIVSGMSLTPYSVNNSGKRTYYDAILRLNSVFNLTSYSYIKITYSPASGYDTEYLTMYVGVSTSTNVTTLNFTAMGSLNGNGTCISNVSSLSGNYYIYIGARSLYARGYQKAVTISTITATSS